MHLLPQQWHDCYDGNQLVHHCRTTPCDEIHVCQKPVAMEVNCPSREAATICLNEHIIHIKLSSMYVYIHRLVLPLAFVREDSFCSM